ncbi:MAG TPA: radical SAM protein [Candidatus Brocadiia bacterium]|nr:radical SAM protein [Candidatus Brocadiia bacterium]
MSETSDNPRDIRTEFDTLRRGRATDEYLRKLRESINSTVPSVPPFRAEIHIATRCNGRCNYCPSWVEKGELTPPELIERFIREFHEVGGQYIGFFGGEPMLHPQLPNFLKLCRNLGLQCGFVTNGLNLDRENMRRIVDAAPSLMLLSVDSLKPETYERTRGVSGEKVLNAIKVLEEMTPGSGIQVLLACVISSANMDDPIPLLEFAEKRGWWMFYQGVHIDRSAPTIKADLWPSEAQITRIEGVMEELVTRKRRGAPIMSDEDYLANIGRHFRNPKLMVMPCLVGWISMFLEPDGTVYPGCGMKPAARLGSRPLAEIWRSPAFRLARLRMRHGLCRGCWWQCTAEESLFWMRTLGIKPAGIRGARLP